MALHSPFMCINVISAVGLQLVTAYGNLGGMAAMASSSAAQAPRKRRRRAPAVAGDLTLQDRSCFFRADEGCRIA